MKKIYVQMKYTIAPYCNDAKSEWFFPHTAIVEMDQDVGVREIETYLQRATQKMLDIITSRHDVQTKDVHLFDAIFLGRL